MGRRDMKRVIIVPSEQKPAFMKEEEAAGLVGRTGLLTGRTLGELVEVRISVDGARPFGYLLHPSQVKDELK